MAVEVMVPRLGWSMESGVFGEWLKREGEAVAAGDPVFTIEGEKATEEVESEDAGVLHIRPGVAEPGVELTVGTVIGWLLADGEAVPEAPAAPVAAAAPKPQADADAPPDPAPEPAAADVGAPRGRRSDGRPASSPRARRVAGELGVDWRLASGSGRSGRIRERDVRVLAAAAPLPDPDAWGPVQVVPLSAARRLAAERLAAAARTVPTATQLGTADVTRLQALRERFAARAQASGAALTMAAMLVKVAASALKVFPQCNATIDPAGGRLLRRGYCHVGVAVDGEHGTSWPVVRDADRKNMLRLAVEIAELTARARAGALKPADTQGSCLSIHQPDGPAGAGIGHFTPPVAAPEAAILGVSPVQKEAAPDPDTGAVARRLRLPLSLTYDCRVIDGADGMRFLCWIIDALEEPLLLSLEG